jgi:DNA-directed RNA polymerase specialized sigma24 family protein
MGWPRLAQSCPRKYDRRPVIRMVFEGYSLRDISRRLDVPYATVWRIAQTVR